VINPISSGAVIDSKHVMSGSTRELKTVEFQVGDIPEKFAVTIPLDAVPGTLLRVLLGGREFSVMLPDYIHPGEKIIVIAPAPTFTTAPSAPLTTQTSVSPTSTAVRAGAITNTPTNVPTGGLQEIKAREYTDDDIPARYPFTIPSDARVGEVLHVLLSGRSFTIRMPEHLRPGDHVVVIAPAAII